MSLDEPRTQLDPAALLKPEEAAEIISLTPRALEAWRSRGGGPRYVKVSAHCVRYRRVDLMDWAEGRLRAGTRDT